MSDADAHSFGRYSSTSSQNKSLESCLQQSLVCASTSSASGGIEQNTVPRTNSSKPPCLDEEPSGASFSSLQSVSEPTASWVRPSKQPLSLTNSSYPRVFCNPVSDCENPDLDHPQQDSFTDNVSSFMMTTSNHQGSTVEEASPNPSNSTSSNDDMLVDVERSNETQEANQLFEPSSVTQVKQHRCGVCKRLLSQKSPWCSHKILRSGDMPAAGVFPCHHVYHVECLDKVTPTSQTRDPSCPACSNTIGEIEQPLIVHETLQQALRSLRRSHTALGSELLSTSCNNNHRRSHKWEKLSCCLNIRFLSSS